MAQIETSDSGHGKGQGKVRSKKQSTNIDFTPMVDLGFLLITFFMLTTTLSKPQTMEINYPDKNKDSVPPPKIPESQSMTIVLGERNNVYYYFGINNPILDSTDFGPTGIRKVLLKENRDRNKFVDSIPIYRNMLDNRKITKEQYRAHVSSIKAYPKGLIVIIKAMEKSKYKNLVDILDEMAICNIGRYAVVNITDADLQLIAGTLTTLETQAQ
jgi:biopolymer transport protein ExbD